MKLLPTVFFALMTSTALGADVEARQTGGSAASSALANPLNPLNPLNYFDDKSPLSNLNPFMSNSPLKNLLPGSSSTSSAPSTSGTPPPAPVASVAPVAPVAPVGPAPAAPVAPVAPAPAAPVAAGAPGAPGASTPGGTDPNLLPPAYADSATTTNPGSVPAAAAIAPPSNPVLSRRGGCKRGELGARCIRTAIPKPKPAGQTKDALRCGEAEPRSDRGLGLTRYNCHRAYFCNAKGMPESRTKNRKIIDACSGRCHCVPPFSSGPGPLGQ